MMPELVEDTGLFLSHTSSILPWGFDFWNEDRRGDKYQFQG
jgi:hypothetical protein